MLLCLSKKWSAPTALLKSSKRQSALLVSRRLWQRVEVQQGTFSKESGSDNTAACRTFCSCWKQVQENVKVRTPSRFQLPCPCLCNVDVTGIDAEVFYFSYLLLRKQLWMILMMNAAASFSLIWGLNRPLITLKKKQKHCVYKLVANFFLNKTRHYWNREA